MEASRFFDYPICLSLLGLLLSRGLSRQKAALAHLRATPQLKQKRSPSCGRRSFLTRMDPPPLLLEHLDERLAGLARTAETLGDGEEPLERLFSKPFGRARGRLTKKAP
jgi:hypothetical protein